MATTKLSTIKCDELKAIEYIANPEKTDNGRLIYTYCCHEDPHDAHKDFSDMRKNGSGRSTVLCKHMIQSFLPGEITPEEAMELGKELCDEFLGGNYQYYLAVHTDKNHVHVHVLVNNISMTDYRTFETNMNRGTRHHRASERLMEASDKICKKHHLSVIEDHESTKGQSHFEWEMDQKGLSWKSKLKNSIDEVVMQSEDFDDFLRKCPEHGILVSYNPQHKIDLKFMLEEQKKNNPKAKFTRARTLGWFYETKQIIRLIEHYRGRANFVARTKIIRTNVTRFMESPALENYAMRENMKETSKALNILYQDGVTREEIQHAAQLSHIRAAAIAQESNKLKTQIADVDLLISAIRDYNKYKPVRDELRTLTGRKKAKFYESHTEELQKLKKASDQLSAWFPNGNVPTLEMAEAKKKSLMEQRTKKDEEYKTVKSEAEQLGKAMRTVEDYLSNERDMQNRKKKNNDLE